MDTQQCVPAAAFAHDPADLDQEGEHREREGRVDRRISEKTVDLIAGLVAGMALVGRAVR